MMFIFSCLTLGATAQDRYVIQGQVLAGDSTALSGATVVLWPDQDAVLTDEQGRFSFGVRYEGTYRLDVTHVGHRPLAFPLLLAQQDTSVLLLLEPRQQQLNEITVTGQSGPVDNLIKAKNAAMPVAVITRREIELMGSRRLDEVMKEQTGVAIVNDIAGGSRAVGVQVQGFSSDYVMVLIDGQPLMGRNSGNFDLSRISVTNIERIEIIKGASSCLYGSDALGGAINIITRHGTIAPQAHASLMYGSLNIVDGTLEAEAPFHHQRGSVVASANYYRTDGYNTNAGYMSAGTTVPPYSNHSMQGRVRYRIRKNGTFGLTARYARRQSTMVNVWPGGWVSNDHQSDRDFNGSLSYDHRFAGGMRSMSRYYFTQYHNRVRATWINAGNLVGAEAFGQQVHRLEQQFTQTLAGRVQLTGGLGASIERMADQSLTGVKPLSTVFGFLQAEWSPLSRLHATLGMRYDHTSVYKGKPSPSLGLQYALSSAFTVKGGIGAGFKAPDYKMRYQLFYNPTANYVVVGTDKVYGVLQTMDEAGELSYKNSYMVGLTASNLRAENSLSSHLGFGWKAAKHVRLEALAFYHHIRNQINTVAIANGTTVGQVFTYRNLPRAVNWGGELSAGWQLTPSLELSAGYQYLISKDLAVIDSIRAGKFPYNQLLNDPATGQSRPVSPGSYWGIEGRSRHMANFRLHYEYRPWQLNLTVRANIRGRYPFQEINGNQFIDIYDAFVPVHTLFNVTVEKKLLADRLSLRAVADNIGNFTHMYMPGQPGRVILGGINYRWFKN